MHEHDLQRLDRLRADQLPILTTLRPQDSLFAALDRMLSTNSSAAVVVDEAGAYRGALDMNTIRTVIHTSPEREPAGPRRSVPTSRPARGRSEMVAAIEYDRARTLTAAAPHRRRWLRYLIRPLLLGLLLVAIYLYVSVQRLDLLEQRSLNADYILNRTLQHVGLTEPLPTCRTGTAGDVPAVAESPRWRQHLRMRAPTGFLILS